MFWGPVSQLGVLKLGILYVGSKHFAPQGKAGSWAFPPTCTVLCWVWSLQRECALAIPPHFDMGVFSFA